MLKYCFSFFLLFCSSLVVLAANSTDKCVVHLDKSFYVTGEVVWYQLYLTPAFKAKPAVVRATILDKKGEIRHSSFLKTEGRTAVAGYYKIPFDLSSGNYLLQFSSINKIDKQSIVLLETVLPIYNDLEGIPQFVKNESAAPISTEISSIENELTISIQLPKTVFKPRDKINPKITVKNKNGELIPAKLSISVVDHALVNIDSESGRSLQSGVAISPNMVELISDKLYLKGIAKEDNGKVHSKKVLGSYYRPEDKILYTKTTESGAFYLALPAFYGNRNIQLVGQQSDYERIKISGERALKIDKLPPLVPSRKIVNYLNLSRQRKKIFQEFNALESNLVLDNPKLKRKTVKPDAEYVTKEYEDFKYMSLFFKENLTPLRFRLQDSIYVADMYNPKNQSYYKFFAGKPLLIIDDIMTRDGDFLARMRMSNIEKVELIYELATLNKQYKLFGANGVTKVTTYDKIENLPVFESNNIIEMNGLQKPAAFPAFDPAQINNVFFQPFFRPQVYWNAALNTQKNGEIDFSYFQTDDISTFQIKVVAQSDDGAIGYKTFIYTVE